MVLTSAGWHPGERGFPQYGAPVTAGEPFRDNYHMSVFQQPDAKHALVVARLRRLWRWYRRSCGVCLIVMGLVSLIAVATGHDRAVSAVVVTNRDIVAGSTLSVNDLAVVSMPTELVPDGAFTDSSSAAGCLVTGGLSRGQPVVAHNCLSAELAKPGEVIVPVRLSDDTIVDLMSPSQHINFYAARAEGAPELIVRSARVVTVIGAGSSQHLLESSSRRTVVVAVDAVTASYLATQPAESLSVTLMG